MRVKTTQEKNAATRQAELLSNALTNAQSSGGYWLNAAGRFMPRMYRDNMKDGVAVSPFNGLMLALHSGENGYKTALYTTFNEAKARGTGILSKQRGMPFNWYSWEKYVNRHNPSDIITRNDYLQLSTKEREQYKGIQKRQIMTVFNIEQTSMPVADVNGFNRLISSYGRYEDRVHEKNEEKELHVKVNKFIEKMKENLVPVRRDASGLAYYDSSKDAVYIPDQKAFENYPEYVQELLRQIVSATGHQQRLAREGMVMHNGKAPSEDAVKQERLVTEIASALKMQELGLPAKLSDASFPIVEYWTRELHENPCLIDAIETDVNNIINVIKKAEEGEKIEYARFRYDRETTEEKEKNRPHVDSNEAAILVDIIAHGGMLVSDGNFQTTEEKNAFLEKFAIKNFEGEKFAASQTLDSDDEEIVEQGWTDVQTAAARIVERCSEYLPHDWRENGHYFIADEISRLPNKAAKEMVVVKDTQTGIADVILPACAMSGGNVVLQNGDKRPYYITPNEVMPEQERNELGLAVKPNELKGFNKSKIEAALKADGMEYVRFYNKDGALGYRPDDSYFKGKEVTVQKLSGKELKVCSNIDTSEAVKAATSTIFDDIRMLRDDDDRWTLYLKPHESSGYGIYPDKEGINRFFSTIKQGQSKESCLLRQDLAEKYHAMATNQPQLKVNLFGEEASAEDLERITHVSMFKNKEGKLMCLPTIEGEEKLYPREVSQEQWQRMWIAEDTQAYKNNLAAKLFCDVLHKEQKTETAKNHQQEASESQERDSNKDEVKLSPMQKQYKDFKDRHPDAMLLFRCGDFYETYHEDAEKASKILGITLTKSSTRRDGNGNPMLLAGFPHHALDVYLPKLIRAGQRVAIYDDLTTSQKQTKSLERELFDDETQNRGMRR